MVDTPLIEAKIDSLDELFHRDPLAMSDKDWDTIVEEMRKRSALWAKAEAEGKRPKAAKAPQAAVPVSTSDFD